MTGQEEELFRDEPGTVDQANIGLLRPGQKAAFIFPFEVDKTEGILTLRFTDDDRRHWQRDNDLSLEQLDSRDW